MPVSRVHLVTHEHRSCTGVRVDLAPEEPAAVALPHSTSFPAPRISASDSNRAIDAAPGMVNNLRVDRLYTAFVSSTFVDLVKARKLIADNLLSQDCVPLGMEFFPSTGANQWESILESISSSDFCVFMIAGRYGSMVPDLGISWTHREFREATTQGKPIIVLIHNNVGQLAADRVESEPVQRERLEHFKREVEETTGCRYFSDDTELLTGLFTSISALKRDGKIEGWIPAGKRPMFVQETDFTMTYDLIEAEHVLRRSSTDPSKLDDQYTSRRKIRGNLPEGVKSVIQDFSRSSEALPFNSENQPTLTLEEGNRSGPGTVRLAPPRKTIGASFVQDVIFSPPIGRDEQVDISISAYLPSYKFAFMDDLLRAGPGTLLGPTTFDFVARIVSFPTNLLIIRVFLPDSLGALPAGPRIGRQASVDDAGSADLVSADYYREWPSEVGGSAGVFMQLRVPEPKFNRTYRLCWTPPLRA